MYFSETILWLHQLLTGGTFSELFKVGPQIDLALVGVVERDPIRTVSPQPRA